MKYTLKLFFFLFSLTTFAQNFSGEIEYKIDLIPKKENINLDSIWSSKNGDNVKYLITDNYYKSTYFENGKPTYSYTYDNKSKRMYDEYAERDYITFRDSRKSNYRYYDSKVFKDKREKVFGLDCFVVEYDSDYGKSKSYYSEEIKVNYSAFKDHKVGNWYNKLKEVDGCLPIKTITEFDDYIEIREAVNIKKLKLDKSDFQLPSDKFTVASHTSLDKKVELIQPNARQIQIYQQVMYQGLKKIELKKNQTCYLSLVVHENGKISNITPLEKDSLGLYKIAKNIIIECELEFIPGEIDGEKVSSLAYFPIEFSK